MDNVRTKIPSISEQALFLLDDFHSYQSRKKIDFFSSIDQCVIDSFSTPNTKEKNSSLASSNNTTPFVVAARLSRTNYDEQAKSEALLHALQKLRTRSPATISESSTSGRIIRSR